ncbi:ba76b53d-723f-4252-8c7a-8384286b405a [Thermothielavioides terrestris]|uniref:Ba76b53d-723f-4252-8c7a-8384286b405a n=1 Tax=Thermothielavioides terrestris TaxID=2587410 RepID=A0A446BCP0_9PEZI|nr:ba76b53d-723f-4252-8c7a-8384286b405a [Thermothielavioides terrestris]
MQYPSAPALELSAIHYEEKVLLSPSIKSEPASDADGLLLDTVPAACSPPHILLTPPEPDLNYDAPSGSAGNCGADYNIVRGVKQEPELQGEEDVPSSTVPAQVPSPPDSLSLPTSLFPRQTEIPGLFTLYPKPEPQPQTAPEPLIKAEDTPSEPGGAPTSLCPAAQQHLTAPTPHSEIPSIKIEEEAEALFARDSDESSLFATPHPRRADRPAEGSPSASSSRHILNADGDGDIKMCAGVPGATSRDSAWRPEEEAAVEWVLDAVSVGAATAAAEKDEEMDEEKEEEKEDQEGLVSYDGDVEDAGLSDSGDEEVHLAGIHHRVEGLQAHHLSWPAVATESASLEARRATWPMRECEAAGAIAAVGEVPRRSSI